MAYIQNDLKDEMNGIILERKCWIGYKRDGRAQEMLNIEGEELDRPNNSECT